MFLVKIIAFLLIFLYILPFMTAICCFFPLFRHIFFAAMVYCTSNEIFAIHLISYPRWTGTSRGYAFTIVYLFAVPVLLSTLIMPQYKVKLFPPGFFFYFLYFLAVLLSGINAIYMQQWGFEVVKMVWMYVIFLAAFNYLNNCKDLRFFICTVSVTVVILFLFGLKQKYVDVRRFQVASTFPHQNSLSLYLEVFGLLSLGVLMNERMNKLMSLLVAASFGSSVLLILFTFSRGGFVIFFGGVALVCALSILFNGFSSRRLLLMLFGLVFLLSVIGYALPRVILRFTKAPESSKNTRIALAIAARRIANDYRLGCGANNFTAYSGGRGKHNYSRELYDTPRDFGGIVETIYLLVAAECGWYGLAILLIWFLYYYLSTIISMFVLRRKPCSGIVIGLFAGLTCWYWHSTLEWSLKQPNNFSQQMIVYALIGVIAVNRKNIKAAYKRALEKKKQEELLQAQLKAQLREQLKKQSIGSAPEAKPVQPLNV